MKVYGGKKTTEFTRKQIGCIYAAAKRGELKVEKWAMNELYNLADYYGYDDNHSVANVEGYILRALAAFFNKDLTGCQLCINDFTEASFNSFTTNYSATFCRDII